jgi:hypothetical protein
MALIVRVPIVHSQISFRDGKKSTTEVIGRANQDA